MQKQISNIGRLLKAKLGKLLVLLSLIGGLLW